MDEYLTASEVARRLGVSKAAVYKWVTEGRLMGSKFGRAVRIQRSSVERFEAEARMENPQKNGTPGLMVPALR